MKLPVIIEKNDDELWGRIEGKGNFMPTTAGSTTKELLDNLKLLIVDYLQHEGQEDKGWNKVDVNKTEFELRYDLQAFFEEHDFLKQTKIAQLAGIDPGLLRQYSSGVKYPSSEQAKKIESAIHNLAEELQAVSIYSE